MTQITSFIDGVITGMGEKHGSKFAVIARTVQKQSHKDVANRIALAFIKLGNDRIIARRTNNEPAVKPELMLTFVQNVMNGVCWAARRLILAQEQAEAEDQANGVDFSQDIAAQVGVECTSTENIEKMVEDDAFILGNVHAWLSSKMGYLPIIEDFHLFADYAPADGMDMDTGEIDMDVIDFSRGAWVLKRSASTFAEAQAIMEELIAELAEEEAERNHAEATSIDFASFGTRPQGSGSEARDGVATEEVTEATGEAVTSAGRNGSRHAA